MGRWDAACNSFREQPFRPMIPGRSWCTSFTTEASSVSHGAMLTAYSARWARRTTPRAARALRRRPRAVSPARRRAAACARCRGFENAAPRLLLPARCPRRAGYEPNAQSRPGASGRAVTPCPPDSRARARGLRRRCSCSSPPTALAARRLGAVRCLRAAAASRSRVRRLPARRPRRGATSRTRSRGPARERPGGHAASARLPCTCKAASPALLVLFAAPRTRGSSAQRPCGGLRAAAASRIPRRDVSPLEVPAARLRAEHAAGATRERPAGHAAPARLPCTCRRLRRRCSCSSPPPALASRRPGAVRWLRARQPRP